MEAEKSQTDVAIGAVGSPAARNAAMDSCGWMKIDTKDASFMTKVKDQVSGFIHAPMEEHKACLIATVQKMAERFSLSKSKEDHVPEEDHIEAQTQA